MLPYLNAVQTVTRQHAAAFRGLNRSDYRQEGDFASMTNLSCRRYPYLAPRLPRAAQEYENPCALFAWDGVEIVADGGRLLYGGESLCNVGPDPKQFAVVNTKLVVWPDRLVVDLVDKSVVRLAAKAVNSGLATFTKNSVSFPADPVYDSGSYSCVDKDGKSGPWIWTYGAVSWSEETGWVLEDPRITGLFALDSYDYVGRFYIPRVSFNEDTNRYTIYDPEVVVWSRYDQTGHGHEEPEPANNLGFYSKITGASSYDYKDVGWEATIRFDHYYAPWFQDSGGLDFRGTFVKGQYIDVTGATVEGNNQSKLRITDVTETTITVDGEPFTEGSDEGAVQVTGNVPPLDYICEHENRLWGVSSKEKTIYCSALGDPMVFYDYSGEDTDGYAVAVGSEGDFTGICSYGGAVLCWKERTLHKMLGSVPSNFQMATYKFSGVRAGAYKSLRNINEVLYYLGPDGVYSYGGNLPTLISRELGADVLKDGVAGTDGRGYYLSVLNGDAWELLCYDSQTGFWTREDSMQCVDFCTVDDKLKFLSGTTVYTVGEGEEAVDWACVLIPVDESLQSRMAYSRLLLRVQVPAGSTLAADIRFDGGEWLQAGTVSGRNAGEGWATQWIPIHIRRCDRYEVRMRGRGDCLVLELLRESQLRGTP